MPARKWSIRDLSLLSAHFIRFVNYQTPCSSSLSSQLLRVMQSRGLDRASHRIKREKKKISSVTGSKGEILNTTKSS